MSPFIEFQIQSYMYIIIHQLFHICLLVVFIKRFSLWKPWCWADRKKPITPPSWLLSYIFFLKHHKKMVLSGVISLRKPRNDSLLSIYLWIFIKILLHHKRRNFNLDCKWIWHQNLLKYLFTSCLHITIPNLCPISRLSYCLFYRIWQYHCALLSYVMLCYWVVLGNTVISQTL